MKATQDELFKKLHQIKPICQKRELTNFDKFISKISFILRVIGAILFTILLFLGILGKFYPLPNSWIQVALWSGTGAILVAAISMVVDLISRIPSFSGSAISCVMSQYCSIEAAM